MIPDSIRQQIDEAYALSPEQISQFQQDGFIHLKDVFSREVIEFFEPHITRTTIENDPSAGLDLDDKTLYGKAFIQVGNLWQHDDIVREFTMGKRLARLGAELMEVAGIRLYHDQSLYKEPSGGFTPWHVDQQYWPMDSGKSVTAWIPLQDTPMEMGPLCFGKGSHLKHIARDLEISEESERVIREAIGKEKIVEIQEPYSLGDVSFHFGWTLHRAGGNSTEKPRRVHTVIYMDEQMRLKAKRSRNQENDRISWCGETQDGELIDGPLTPTLYSTRG